MIRPIIQFMICMSIVVVATVSARAQMQIQTQIQTQIQMIHSKKSRSYPAVVQLANDEGLFCTGEIVGLHPTTVVTAGHCLLEQFRVLQNHEPSGTYTLAHSEADDSKDVAVLVYKDVDMTGTLSVTQLFSVATVQAKLGDPISICGFGSTATLVDNQGTQSDDLRCGTNVLSAIDGKFTPVTQVQSPFSEQDLRSLQQMYLEQGAQVFTIMVSVADGAVLGPRCDEKVNANAGDSGGPWFTEDSQGLHLLGVTSSGLDIAQKIVASTALNLNSADARATLQGAIQHLGADILGFR
jgi:V8-like Glu-specific endopeptidase